MFYNLQQLQNEVSSRLKTHNQLVNLSRITRWANETQDEVSLEFEPDHLMKEIDFSIASGTSIYYFDIEYNKILSITDVDGDFPVDELEKNELELIDPDRDDSSRSPEFWVKEPTSWVKAQPDSASTISIVSDQIGDTSVQVRIRGVVGGIEDTELLTLNGTTTVTGTKLFTEIHTIAKSATTDGVVTATMNDTGSTEVAKIAANSLVREYMPVRLYPNPSATRQYRARGIRKPRRLVYDQDFPDYPETYHELILLGTLIRGHNDLFKPTLAEQIREKEYKPLRDKLKEQSGQRRSRKARRLKGNIGGEVFDHKTGTNMILRVPDLVG